MTTYASTFIVGLKDVIAEMLEELFPKVRILLLLDGLIIYEVNISIDQIRRLRFLNNSFIVLRTFKKLRNNPLHEMLTAVANDKKLNKTMNSVIEVVRRNNSFRLVTSMENQTVAVDKKLQNVVENKISGILGLKVHRSKPDMEFWFLYRSEGYGFFLTRFTKHKAYEKILEKGELKPELSHTLSFISEPNESDIFLDPFCGYGSIPIERAQAFPYNMIFATDKDPEKKKFVRNRLKSLKTKNTFIVKNIDALNLESFEANFIHKIVTDPPWGLFEEMEINPSDFHLLMLKEFHRILRVNGILVILTAKKDEFEDALSEFYEDLKLLNKYDILVSGKKASVYKVEKIS